MTKKQIENRARKEHNDECAEVRKQFPPMVQSETQEREEVGRLFITTHFFPKGERTHNVPVANVHTAANLDGTDVPNTLSTISVE